MAEHEQVSVFKQENLQKWLLGGLLIRLLVMPFTAHSDLLSIYYRAHLILEGRAVKGLGPNIFNLMHAGFLWLIKPLLPYQILWGAPKLKTFLMLDWLGFVNQPDVFRALFLFKLPYLAVEVLAVWMLLKLTEPQRRRRVLIFWIFNPIVIFSTYIFGRFDMITVFLLLSALYLAQVGRNNWSLLVLGVAALLRMYPIVLVLPFALILESGGWRRARLAAIGFAPLAVSIFGGLTQGEAGIVKNFASMQHLSYPLAMKFYLGSEDNLYIFVFLYSLLLMYLFVTYQPGLESLKRNCLYVFLLFFATSFFHPHYLIWLVPFVAFFFDEPTQFQSIYRIHIIGWAIYTFQWGRSLAGYLLAPLSPAFFWSALSPSEWIDRYYPTVQFIGIGRSLFSATCLAMAYLVWRRRAEAAGTPAPLTESEKGAAWR